jgi:hypothetical protein
MGVQSYRDLVAWQKGMDMVEAVYRVTQTWPHDEVYGLTNQARRAAVAQRLGYLSQERSRPYWPRPMRSAGCSVDSYAACADDLPPTA